MRIALLELRRRPGRFATAAVILTLIALLLMFLGGLLDGLIRSSTGAVRAQRGDVIVSSSASQNSFLRSRIDPALRTTIEAVPGVTATGGIGIVQLGARIPGKGPRDLADVALFGYELAPRGVPATPPDGEVYADRLLEESGIRLGMQVLLGPARSPVTVIGFVEDTNYLGQGGMWASPDTWRRVLVANRPAEQLGAGVFQSLVVQGEGSPATLAAAIDAGTAGATSTLPVPDAAQAIPGVKEQQGTFSQIIGVTVAIAVVVVALFFALLTVERSGLYGVFKAIGARSRTIFAGLVAQAVVVTLVASVVAGVAAFALDLALPASAIPLTVTPARLVSSVGFLLLAAVIGCAFSLRRVLRIDPASAIGSAS